MLRPLARDDLDPLADVLARAFHDDPPWVWSQPNPRKRARRTRLVYRGRLGTLWHEPLSLTTEDRTGVALWAAPDRWRVPAGEMLRAEPAMVGPRIVPILRGMRRIERLHPDGHVYLAALAVDPARQGNGVGSALLRPGLEWCDREGVPAFLETAKERNVAFYARHGFRVTHQLAVARGGPPVWLMARAPR